MTIPNRYLVADTETTGIDPKAKACEVGWIEINEDFEIINQVESIIDPERPISSAAGGVHGLTNAECQDSPTIEEFFSQDDPSCYGKPLDGKVVLIGHRISFDVRFLAPYIPNLYQQVCTLRWARKLYPDSDNHQLSTLRFALDLPKSSGAHRVMGDVMTAYWLARHVCERTGMTLGELTEASRNPMELLVFPFGKHKGAPFADVPKGYLMWAKSNMDLEEDMLYTIDLVLNNKKKNQ